MAAPDTPAQARRVTCLLPAYNEAPRIGAVLDVVTRHPLIHEVIVIDDGSTDATANVAARKGVTLILMPQNGGKSRAIAAGGGRRGAGWALGRPARRANAIFTQKFKFFTG